MTRIICHLMRYCWGLAGVLIAGELLAAEPAGKPSQDAAQIADAGAKYRKGCITCHQPPDLRFATDKAWLDQVMRTG